MYLGVIVNPLAQKNRVGKGDRAARLQRLVGPWGEVHETESVHALPGIVDRLYSRCSHLVSDGGDGSLHWLINEMLFREPDPRRWPTFVPTNGGSIDFVARKARVRGRADTILPSLAAANRRKPDDLAPIVQDLTTLLERILPGLQRGRYPEKQAGHQVATLLRAVADQLDV